MLSSLCTDDSGAAPCSCKSRRDAKVCGGSDSCTVKLQAGDEYACVYVKMDADDVLEDDRTETLNLTSGDDGVIIGDPGMLEIRVIDDDCESIGGDVCMLD